ncbi:MAG: peptidylprolyl isomerase [Roseivirga sp.]
MNRLLAFVSFLLLLNAANLSAFQKPVEIARIDNTPILADEFLYAFKKNRDPEISVTKDSLLSYLDRFINFKLKVLEARRLGTDTLTSFRQEYESYASQVSKPYLDNLNKEEELIKEAYERSKTEVRVSHILIRKPKGALPKDTLAAYQKTDSLRKLAEDGVDFALLASKNSHDGSSQKGGDLGWFSAFAMIYPFETAAYTTQVGTISPITKTQFGYHIVKVTGRRPARGKVRTSHIFIARARHTETEGKRIINQVYDSLKNGGSWNALCKAFSDDQRSKLKNGALPMAGIGQLPEEYLEHAFKLTTKGSYSTPSETPFGWHIIRLDDKQPVPGLEEVRIDFGDRVKRSGRMQYGTDEVLKKLKQDNGFELNGDVLNPVIEQLKVDKRNIDSLSRLHTETLFTIGNKAITVKDFIDHLKAKPAGSGTGYLEAYSQFEQEAVFSFEDSLALIKYPEYRLLLQEYEEGLLLFDIMEDEIWNKALEDSTGLATYFKEHKAEYPAPERALSYIISGRSNNGTKLLPKAKKILEDAAALQNPDSLLKSALPPTEYSLLKIVKRTLTQDDLPIFASGKLTENQPVLNKGQAQLYLIEKVIPAGLYELDEIKGRVTADYQDYLDQQWIRRLRKQSKIKVYKKRVASLLPIG